MSPFKRWAACASLLVGALTPVAGPAAPVCAGEGSRAALVVDTGQGVHNFCVALPDDEVSGLELIALAGEQHGLSYRFGHGGAAVCMLAGVGPTGEDCFEDYPDFWGYWRGSSSGWTWSSSGAGSTSVGNGDVEGWSWGSGNDGNTHPRPPETSFSSVCPATRSSGTGPSRENKQSKERSVEPQAAPPAPAPDRLPPAPRASLPARARPDGAPERSHSNPPERSRDRRVQERSLPVRPEPTRGNDEYLAATELRSEADEGQVPPAAGLAALGAAALLGGAGFVFARRRRGGS